MVLRDNIKEKCLSKKMRLNFRLEQLLEREILSSDYENFLYSQTSSDDSTFSALP